MTTSAIEFTLQDFKGKLSKESDDACVILGAELLQSALGRLFVRRLQADAHQLLSCYGPLGAFPTRIQLAQGLGWISETIWKDLAAVHNIREEVALGTVDGPFTGAIVAERCGALVAAESLLGDPHADGLRLHEGISPVAAPVDRKAARAARHRLEVTVEFLEKHLDGL